MAGSGSISLQSGFSLLQLSIALIIIGLITGGILTGQDLIKTAAMTAQITQIDKYNTAVGTFQNKYGGLPGDLPDPNATQFGFQSRGTNLGEGDGSGIIEGSTWSTTTYGYVEGVGETGVFWVDLSTANLIDGSFNAAQEHNVPVPYPVTNISAWFPQAKIGGGNYVYVWSGGIYNAHAGINFFGISAATKIETSPCDACPNSTPALTVQQAYNIDKKIDDGLPQSGNVTAVYIQEWPAWAAGGGGTGATDNTTANAPSATTCYDNNNIAGAQNTYSLTQNKGNGINCALSFQFKQ